MNYYLLSSWFIDVTIKANSGEEALRKASLASGVREDSFIIAKIWDVDSYEKRCGCSKDDK